MVLGKLFGKKEKFFLEIEPTTSSSESTAEEAAPSAPVAAISSAEAPAATAAVTTTPEPAAAPASAPVAETPAKEIPNVTFAADLSVPAINTGRRLPGPSLDPFAQIVSEVVRR
ncbi:hypothetical protein VZH09_10765 [Synechococcus elongatus IITB7]|uniref:hypothetical protein n=1 Tax=Synechococcus elongatus TaxID=32046 RepID=UPI0030D549E0